MSIDSGRCFEKHTKVIKERVMSTTIETKENGTRSACWKCRTTDVAVDALDMVYRLNCNLCYKYRKENCIQQWIQFKKDKLLACLFCWDSFTFNKSTEVHECSRVGIYQCMQCACQLNSCKSLKKHVKVVHGRKSDSREGGCVCKSCNLLFPTSQMLKEHLRTHVKGKPFACNVCKRTFTKSNNLTQHLRTHTGERPYACTVCNKAFTALGVLTRHLRTHTGEKPFICTVCGNTFTQSASLNRHLRSHVGEKPFVCTVCEKTFTTSGSLKIHSRTHTGERPYVCNVCEKAFTQYQHLTGHLRIHTRETPYSCVVCRKAFSKSEHLNSHLKSLTHNRKLNRVS